MFFAFSIVLLLGVMEIGLRLALPNLGVLHDMLEQTGDSRQFILRPGARKSFQGLYEKLPQPIEWRINSQGLRADRDVAAKSDKYRIAVYGDSEAYGWSVAMDHSLYRYMEAADEAIEVLNFGVPGYNVENVADHMKANLARFRPDLVIYLMHRNDFYAPLAFHPLLSRSYSYMVGRYLIYLSGKDERKARRRSAEGTDWFRGQIKAIQQLAQAHNAPLLVGVLHWEYKYGLPEALQPDMGATAPERSGHYWAETVNLTPAIDPHKRLDHHMPPKAHEDAAKLICRVIARDGGEGCRPASR